MVCASIAKDSWKARSNGPAVIAPGSRQGTGIINKT